MPCDRVLYASKCPQGDFFFCEWVGLRTYVEKRANNKGLVPLTEVSRKPNIFRFLRCPTIGKALELPISPTTGLPEAEHGDWADVLSQQLNQYSSLCCRPCRLRSLESAFFFFPFSHRHSQFRSVFPPYVSIFFG